MQTQNHVLFVSRCLYCALQCSLGNQRESVVQLCCAPEDPTAADSTHPPRLVLQISVPVMAFNTFKFNPLFISSFYGVQNFEATLSFWKVVLT